MLIDKFFYTLKIGGLSFIQSIILFFTLLKLIELKEIEKRLEEHPELLQKAMLTKFKR